MRNIFELFRDNLPLAAYYHLFINYILYYIISLTLKSKVCIGKQAVDKFSLAILLIIHIVRHTSFWVSAQMTNLEAKILSNTFDAVQNYVIFIWLDKTITLKAVIKECKSESKERQYANVLKVNCKADKK